MRIRALLMALLLQGFAGSVFAAEPMSTEYPASVAQMQERVARLEAQLQNQGLLNLLARQEEGRADINRLRGALEEFAHQLKLAEKRQKDYYQELDQRIARLESHAGAPGTPAAAVKDGVSLQFSGGIKGADKTPAAKPALAGPVAAVNKPVLAPESVGGDSLGLYEQGSSLFKRGKYPEAVAAFDRYLKDYPEGELAANALYWLGLSHLALEDFKRAAEAQLRLIKTFPKHDKRADAMLSLARVQARLKKNVQARETLDELIEQYPKSKAASTGRKLRAILD
jgi:tol-pal system protein YbgF